jgi:hypothetical protein
MFLEITELYEKPDGTTGSRPNTINLAQVVHIFPNDSGNTVFAMTSFAYPEYEGKRVITGAAEAKMPFDVVVNKVNELLLMGSNLLFFNVFQTSSNERGQPVLRPNMVNLNFVTNVVQSADGTAMILFSSYQISAIWDNKATPIGCIQTNKPYADFMKEMTAALGKHVHFKLLS